MVDGLAMLDVNVFVHDATQWTADPFQCVLSVFLPLTSCSVFLGQAPGFNTTLTGT